MYQTMGNMKQGGYQNNVRGAPSGAIRRSKNKQVEKYTPPLETYVPASEANPQKASTKSLWGRPLWFSLHYGAFNYPEKLDKMMIDMNVGFIRGLPIMIPCDICKNHAFEFISGFTDAQLREISSDKNKLFEWYWMFHNMVNEKTGKPKMSLEKALQIYRTNPSSAL